MSKSVVKKHCSILNYLRRTEPELYDIIQDLCIARIFVPRKGSGVTFLRPDKNLLKQISSMASGDTPEEAVAAIQSLVLLDGFPSPSDFDSVDVPTYLRKKLPVASVTSNKVTLANGAELTLDKDFESRNDRTNMFVYNITKELVPSNTDPVDMKKYKSAPKSVKGGGDFGSNKLTLFNNVFKQCFDGETYIPSQTGRDPAMEALITMAAVIDPSKRQAFCSQLSEDTLTSLAIVLRPYGASDGVFSPADVSKLAQYTKTEGGLAQYFYYRPQAETQYQRLRQMGVVSSDIAGHRASAANQCARPTGPSVIRDHLRGLDRGDGAPQDVKLAEAELRVLAALLYDNGDVSKSTMDKLYRTCSLDRPCYIGDSSMGTPGVALYYSTTFLIVRSDAFFYTPNQGCTESFSSLIDDQADNISVDSPLQYVSAKRKSFYQVSADLDELFKGLPQPE